MARLALHLLGSPRIERDGEVVELRRRKAVALLAYLAVTGCSHGRDTLATLLWPEQDRSAARGGLRRVLAELKKALGEGWLEVDRECVALNQAADVWLDVRQFQDRLAECRMHAHPEQEVCFECLSRLKESVTLYGDDFMAGFTLRDSFSFDDWQFFQSESLRNDLASALERLARAHSCRGEYEQAILYARRWLALDPLHEPAHRCLMQLYAWSGQRAAAFRQYDECERVLKKELNASPEEETTTLIEQINAGALKVPTSFPVHPSHVPPRLPAFLEGVKGQDAGDRPVFVAREGELAQLGRHLATALDGNGHVVFVTGEAGRGKTALMDEFARHSQESYADLIVASGNCNAFSGVGDPYLPFRDVMEMLAGDVESRWAAGAITREHARRLWALMPYTVQALVEAGPNLIDVFVSGAALTKRVSACMPDMAGWQERLKELTEREKGASRDLEQRQLFEQYTQVLRTLAARGPVLVLLDDLQWVDVASTSLLFHLSRRLRGSRILILGAYRPSEVASGRPSGDRGQDRQHPLVPVINELKRGFGDIHVDLGQTPPTEARRFVDAFLNTEPNNLGEDFRQGLFRHTNGHPLFTIELLRDMQERGGLIQDEEGRWTEGPWLKWDMLPARVEAVIEGRLCRIEGELRDVLTVASVEGEEFTAQVVARVHAISERSTLRRLSQELEKRHRLVRGLGEVQVDGRCLSRYRFGHALFQQYLYNALSLSERRLLHGEIAASLEELYLGCTEEIAVQLAHHFSKAVELEKALVYSLQAAAKARTAYANEAALEWYQHALEVLDQFPAEEKVQSDPQRLSIYKDLGDVLIRVGRWDEARDTYQQALELAQQLDDQPAQAWCQTAMGELVRRQGLYSEASAWFKRAQTSFDDLGDQVGAGRVLKLRGTLAWGQGDYEAARVLYEESLIIHRQLKDEPEIANSLSDLGLVAHYQGDYESARRLYEESLELRYQLKDKWAIAVSLNNLGYLNTEQCDYETARSQLETAISLQREVGDRWMLATALYNLGNVARAQSNYAEARALYEEALTISRELGSQEAIAYLLADIGGLSAIQGQAERALRLTGASEVLCEAIGTHLPPWEKAILERLLEPACQALGEAAASSAVAEGRAMSLEVAIDYALLGG
jgi:adenylate cyclase